MAGANATSPVGPLRAQRLAAGLTQEQVARAAECSLTYVRLLEAGYLPDWDASPKLRRVAAALACGPTELDSPSTSEGPAPNGAFAKSCRDGGKREEP